MTYWLVDGLPDGPGGEPCPPGEHRDPWGDDDDTRCGRCGTVYEPAHEAPTDALLSALRGLHHRGRPARGGTRRCSGCQHNWPCPTIRAVDRYAAQEQS